jgi:uncharacterized protein (DUF1778 family)
LRLKPEGHARIEQAAKVAQQSSSAFVVGAATAQADCLLAGTDITMMPADDFDELLSSLDITDGCPTGPSSNGQMWRTAMSAHRRGVLADHRREQCGSRSVDRGQGGR